MEQIKYKMFTYQLTDASISFLWYGFSFGIFGKFFLPSEKFFWGNFLLKVGETGRAGLLFWPFGFVSELRNDGGTRSGFGDGERPPPGDGDRLPIGDGESGEPIDNGRTFWGETVDKLGDEGRIGKKFNGEDESSTRGRSIFEFVLSLLNSR